MYVAADQIEHSSAGEAHYRFEFGGAQYDGDGRGFRGFQWIIYHYLDEGRRDVSIYEDPFPWEGTTLVSWKEAESAQGDDYLKGTPGPDYVELERYTYDCLGPDRPEAKQAKCANSPDGSYQVRKTSELEIYQDPTSHTIQSEEAHTYVYDCFGRRHEADSEDEVKAYSCGSK
jgi:hypothetical protein